MTEKPRSSGKEVVASLKKTAEAVRGIHRAIGLLVSALHTTPTSYRSRVKITNLLDTASLKINQAAVEFDHEADLQAIAHGITNGGSK